MPPEYDESNCRFKIQEGEECQLLLNRVDKEILKEREGLPIYSFRDRLLQEIKRNRLVFICGETGTFAEVTHSRLWKEYSCPSVYSR